MVMETMEKSITSLLPWGRIGRLVSFFVGRTLHTTGGTTQQRKPYDIVIIGKGPVGLSCAYHCASKGLGRIAVVERDIISIIIYLIHKL